MCLGVKRHLASVHEISRLQHGLQLIMACYTRIIDCRPRCNLYLVNLTSNLTATILQHIFINGGEIWHRVEQSRIYRPLSAVMFSAQQLSVICHHCKNKWQQWTLVNTQGEINASMRLSAVAKVPENWNTGCSHHARHHTMIQTTSNTVTLSIITVGCMTLETLASESQR